MHSVIASLVRRYFILVVVLVGAFHRRGPRRSHRVRRLFLSIVHGERDNGRHYARVHRIGEPRL